MSAATEALTKLVSAGKDITRHGPTRWDMRAVLEAYEMAVAALAVEVEVVKLEWDKEHIEAAAKGYFVQQHVMRGFVPPWESQPHEVKEVYRICMRCALECLPALAPPPALAATPSLTEDAIAALRKWNEAFDGLFAHCVSNGVFNQWGRRFNCTALNEAHETSDAVLRKAGA